MLEIGGHCFGDGKGNRGLPDPSRSHDGDKAFLRQLRRQYAYGVGSANPLGDLSGQIVGAVRGDRLQQRQGRHLVLYDGHRRDEPITPSRNINQVAIPVAAIAEHPPHGSDMNRKVGRLDEHFRPHPRHQLLLADQLAPALDQCNQDIERTATETQRLFGFKQQPLRWNQVEWAKREARWPTVDPNGLRDG